MSFRMQASNPRVLRAVDEDDSQVSEAMETVFPMWAEDAYMVWDGIHIPLSYKYTLSWMLKDLLDMLEQLLASEEGNAKVIWFVEEFNATWDMKWEGGQLHIRSEWRETPSSLAKLLTDKTEITVGRLDFVSEWRQPLTVILDAVERAGYEKSMLSDIGRLRFIRDAITAPGILYRESADEIDEA